MNYSSTWSISFLTIKTTALFIHSSALIKITTQKSFDLKVLLLLNAAVTDHSNFSAQGYVWQHKKLAVLRIHCRAAAKKDIWGCKRRFLYFLGKEIPLWETALPLLLSSRTHTNHTKHGLKVYLARWDSVQLQSISSIRLYPWEPGYSCRGPQALLEIYPGIR